MISIHRQSRLNLIGYDLDTEKNLLLGEMKTRLRLGFKKNGKAIFSNRSSSEADTDAWTTCTFDAAYTKTGVEIWILLDCSIVDPLLRGFLTDSERFGLQ